MLSIMWTDKHCANAGIALCYLPFGFLQGAGDGNFQGTETLENFLLK